MDVGRVSTLTAGQAARARVDFVCAPRRSSAPSNDEADSCDDAHGWHPRARAGCPASHRGTADRHAAAAVDVAASEPHRSAAEHGAAVAPGRAGGRRPSGPSVRRRGRRLRCPPIKGQRGGRRGHRSRRPPPRRHRGAGARPGGHRRLGPGPGGGPARSVRGRLRQRGHPAPRRHRVLVPGPPPRGYRRHVLDAGLRGHRRRLRRRRHPPPAVLRLDPRADRPGRRSAAGGLVPLGRSASDAQDRPPLSAGAPPGAGRQPGADPVRGRPGLGRRGAGQRRPEDGERGPGLDRPPGHRGRGLPPSGERRGTLRHRAARAQSAGAGGATPDRPTHGGVPRRRGGRARRHLPGPSREGGPGRAGHAAPRGTGHGSGVLGHRGGGQRDPAGRSRLLRGHPLDDAVDPLRGGRPLAPVPPAVDGVRPGSGTGARPEPRRHHRAAPGAGRRPLDHDPGGPGHRPGPAARGPQPLLAGRAVGAGPLGHRARPRPAASAGHGQPGRRPGRRLPRRAARRAPRLDRLRVVAPDPPDG